MLVRTAFVLAFFAFLRVGEFTVNTKGKEQQLLQNQDVVVHTVKGVSTLQVTMNSYKHSQKPTSLRIASQSGKKWRPLTSKPGSATDLFPVHAISAYKSIRGNSQGVFFTFTSREPITRAFFIQHYVAALKWCKIDPLRYKGHSFRIGAATTTASRDMADVQIQTMGRWENISIQTIHPYAHIIQCLIELDLNYVGLALRL